MVADTITGFKGVVTARHNYITGNNRYTVEGRVEEGQKPNDYYFDEERLELTEL